MHYCDENFLAGRIFIGSIGAELLLFRFGFESGRTDGRRLLDSSSFCLGFCYLASVFVC